MSSDIEKEPLSRQQKKSKETKARIFHAAKTILQKQGYDQLSIKNICDEAGVSNGSFYHHFKTKDDLLSYYIEEQPSINPDLLDLPSSKEEARETIVYVYLNYVLLLSGTGCGIYGKLLYSQEPVLKSADPYRATLSDHHRAQLSSKMYRCRNHHLKRFSGTHHHRYPYDRYRKCI